MRSAILILCTFLISLSTGWAQRSQPQDPPAPTYTNVAYGDHERHVLDFYRAESDSPTALVMWLHGFQGGDKDGVRRGNSVGDATWTPGTLQHLLDAGISVAAINYPYVTTTPLPGALRLAAGAAVSALKGDRMEHRQRARRCVR